MFQFKQFGVDQMGCAMKINTDGVLLGAIIEANAPEIILDIGTGTGVIALMLAQRFTEAQVDAVEIDEIAATTAHDNFKNSPFADRLAIHPSSFEAFFNQYPERKYDLVISNPPFYINSLKSAGTQKTLAKHTDIDFFEKLTKNISNHLAINGCFWLIIPANISVIITNLAAGYLMYPQRVINVYSYDHSAAHRTILCLSFNKVSAEISKFVIYMSDGVYTDQYKALLQPYFLAF